jgi:hypothetical protein
MPHGPDGRCYFEFGFVDSFHSQTDWFCQYCGCKIWDRGSASRRDPDRATIDHKVPIWRGGSDNSDNLLSVCNQCNTKKGSLTDEEYLKFRDNELLLRVIRRTIDRIKDRSHKRSQNTGIPETIFTGSFLNNRFEGMTDKQLRFCLVSPRRRRKMVKSIERHLAVVKYFKSRQEPIPEAVTRSVHRWMKRSRCKPTDNYAIEVQKYLEDSLTQSERRDHAAFR